MMNVQITVRAENGLVSAPTGFVIEKIHCLNDTKFHTITAAVAATETRSAANSTEASAETIPAGIVQEGRFSAVRIHSGLVRLYCGK